MADAAPRFVVTSSTGHASDKSKECVQRRGVDGPAVSATAIQATHQKGFSLTGNTAGAIAQKGCTCWARVWVHTEVCEQFQAQPVVQPGIGDLSGKYRCV